MSAKDLRHDVRQLIGIFRQSGSTTAAVLAALNSTSYLIVADHAAVTRITRQHPTLKGRVFSVKNLMVDMRGLKSAPLIFDVDAVNQLCMDEKLDEVPPLTIVKVKDNPSAQDLETWREIFETASADKDFKVFTHQAIEVEQIQFNKEHKHQINVKLTEEDVKAMEEINKDFFEGEATNSMLGRIILRKGMGVYKKLKSML